MRENRAKQEYYGRSIESRDDPRALKTDLCKISSKSFHELLPRVPIKQPKLKMIFSPLLFALVSPLWAWGCELLMLAKEKNQFFLRHRLVILSKALSDKWKLTCHCSSIARIKNGRSESNNFVILTSVKERKKFETFQIMSASKG